MPLFFFFLARGSRRGREGREASSSRWRPLLETQGYKRLEVSTSAARLVRGQRRRVHAGPHPTNPTRTPTIALAKAQALLLLFFFISLFHIHISHSMEKPERVRQRWYNRSAVTGGGAGRGGEGTDGLAAYLHSARTLKTQKTKQTVNYPCFLCISVQRRGWRAERGRPG